MNGRTLLVVTLVAAMAAPLAADASRKHNGKGDRPAPGRVAERRSKHWSPNHTTKPARPRHHGKSNTAHLAPVASASVKPQRAKPRTPEKPRHATPRTAPQPQHTMIAAALTPVTVASAAVQPRVESRRSGDRRGLWSRAGDATYAAVAATGVSLGALVLPACSSSAPPPPVPSAGVTIEYSGGKPYRGVTYKVQPGFAGRHGWNLVERDGRAAIIASDADGLPPLAIPVTMPPNYHSAILEDAGPVRDDHGNPTGQYRIRLVVYASSGVIFRRPYVDAMATYTVDGVPFERQRGARTQHRDHRPDAPYHDSRTDAPRSDERGDGVYNPPRNWVPRSSADL